MTSAQPDAQAPSEGAFKAGFAALLGRPNAGKSTLTNALLGSKLSIISSKPQTTRHSILGIVEGAGYQLCLLDTPGLLPKPADPLQHALRRAAKRAAHEDADVLVLLVEPQPPDAETVRELSALSRGAAPVILALNKIDLPVPPGRHDQVVAAYSEAVKPAAVVRLSALKKQGVEELKREIVARLPASPPFYEPGQLSDRWERFFASELIREQVFALYGDELPHATAVVVEQYREAEGRPDQVMATLYVERDGQKGILIGDKGRALHNLQARARSAIAAFVGRPVELDLWIKVRKNWRKDPKSLKEFGYLE